MERADLCFSGTGINVNNVDYVYNLCILSTEFNIFNVGRRVQCNHNVSFVLLYDLQATYTLAKVTLL